MLAPKLAMRSNPKLTMIRMPGVMPRIGGRAVRRYTVNLFLSRCGCSIKRRNGERLVHLRQ